MTQDNNRIIEMTLEGEFVSAPPPPPPPVGTKVMLWAIMTTVIAAAVLIVAVTFWFLVMILPVVLGAAVVGYLAWRYQLWRASRAFQVWRGPNPWSR